MSGVSGVSEVSEVSEVLTRMLPIRSQGELRSITKFLVLSRGLAVQPCCRQEKAFPVSAPPPLPRTIGIGILLPENKKFPTRVYLQPITEGFRQHPGLIMPSVVHLRAETKPFERRSPCAFPVRNCPIFPQLTA